LIIFKCPSIFLFFELILPSSILKFLCSLNTCFIKGNSDAIRNIQQSIIEQIRNAFRWNNKDPSYNLLLINESVNIILCGGVILSISLTKSFSTDKRWALVSWIISRLASARLFWCSFSTKAWSFLIPLKARMPKMRQGRTIAKI